MIPNFLNTKAIEYQRYRKYFFWGIFVSLVLMILVSTMFSAPSSMGFIVMMTFSYSLGICFFITALYFQFSKLWSSSALTPISYAFWRVSEWINGLVIIIFLSILVLSYPVVIIYGVFYTN